MKRTTKKPAATHKRLLLIACFLIAFTLGLVVAAIQPGAVLALLVVLALVVVVLLGESFYLWQLAKRRELSKPVRVKKSLPQKEVEQ